MFLNKIVIFIIVFMFSSIASAAAVYKWVDEDGQVHYGSKSKSENAKFTYYLL